MTVKVETGITLAALQELVGRRGQWLPLDPPQPERLTIAELLSSNLSGPRRVGYGTIRDYLIGLQVALPDGRLAASGGNVVKNVAGYDMMKLFVGARNTLGFPVEATFKLLPRPQAEVFVQSVSYRLEDIDRLTNAVLDSPLTPSVLDWYTGLTSAPWADGLRLVLGFAGTAEEVRWQLECAAGLNIATSTTLEYERAFWALPELVEGAQHSSAVRSRSVLPSRLASVVSTLGTASFVARAGSGLVHYRLQSAGELAHSTPAEPAADSALRALAGRIKNVFDPNGILPELPA
jgi:glycolate oxidase FAD binding subunit